jgi:aspartyl-tRNA(Asn)/glutamyl-tRNA(Gln) amidotransferase subunit C
VKINEEQVRYVAGLANLRLTNDEVARMAKEMDSILTHIDALSELDTTGVEPMAQVLYAGNDGLREDVEGATIPNETVTANAAMAGAGFFKVPRVIER